MLFIQHIDKKQLKLFIIIFIIIISILTFFSHTSITLVGLHMAEVSRSHSDMLHSIELLWKNYLPVAGTAAGQNTSLARNRHPCHRRV